MDFPWPPTMLLDQFKDQRELRDLLAQEAMANWAFWMLVITAASTFVGLLSVYFIYKTFRQSNAAMMIQREQLELQKKELEENRTVLLDQAKAAENQAEFIGLQTEAMREQIDLQRQVAATSHKVAMFPQRFTIYLSLRDFRRQIRPHTALEISEVFEHVQSICFIYGKAFKECQKQLLRPLNEYRNSVQQWEEYWGRNTFVTFESLLESIDIEKDDAMRESSQLEMYNEVKQKRTAVFAPAFLHDALFLMQVYLEIEGEVGIETQVKSGAMESLRDTRRKLMELGMTPD
ncbi:hypothetical protein JZX86_27620 [Agrobacterium rosae]|uniref:hypothetical protein n=1 Tax=Agrobacterium rosae TaxID=1972867 RepID=UPI0019D32FD6|nr:hypothetical protein [Agrobacterium rosae]MBN7809092.1 hypothetical protein [Agrobacterium rosae]